jgi:23S rRNA pseudouridine1911/1915/1917 synthase
VDVTVLYEDEWIAAIDKPPGVVVHPTYRNWTGTILNGLLWRYQSRAVEPRIATRLDKDTSGLVIVALSADVHARVQRDMSAGRVRKEYLAIVRGVPTPASDIIALPLARSAEDRRRVVVSADGQPCRTQYQVLSTANGSAVVRCVLLTGRSHQIRVHLSASGWPIEGDRVYGPPDTAIHRHRQALHAWRVTMPHPISRRPLEFEAPIPADMQDVRERLQCSGFRL